MAPVCRLALVRHGESEAQTKHLIGRNEESPLSEAGVAQARQLGAFHAAALTKAAAAGLLVSSPARRAVQTCEEALAAAFRGCSAAHGACGAGEDPPAADAAAAEPPPPAKRPRRRSDAEEEEALPPRLPRPRLVPELNEIFRGDLDGAAMRGEVAEKWKASRKAAADLLEWRPAGGGCESFGEVMRRVVPAVDAAAEDGNGAAALDLDVAVADGEGEEHDRTLWVFAHSVVIRSLLWHHLGCGPRHLLNIANTSVCWLRRVPDDGGSAAYSGGGAGAASGGTLGPWSVDSMNDTGHLAVASASTAAF